LPPVEIKVSHTNAIVDDDIGVAEEVIFPGEKKKLP
jgi:hypothetical protein